MQHQTSINAPANKPQEWRKSATPPSSYNKCLPGYVSLTSGPKPPSALSFQQLRHSFFSRLERLPLRPAYPHRPAGNVILATASHYAARVAAIRDGAAECNRQPRGDK